MRRHPARDLFLYVLIGSAVGALPIVLAIYAPGLSAIDFRWIELTANTLITFGVVLKWFDRSTRTRLFWIIYSGFFCVHLVCYVFVMRNVDRYGILRYAFYSPVEWSVFFPVLLWGARKTARDTKARCLN